jgi:hypothetical protein
MWSLCPATVSELEIIYNLQNIPFRFEALGAELPAYPQFLAEQTKGMDAGIEKYFLLNENEKPAGFVHLTLVSEFWHATLWGPWLKTLVYCAGLSAFVFLKVPRLVWNVRQNNKRMVKVCEKYPFRFLGENNVFVLLNEAPYVGIDKVNYYEITSERFFETEDFFRKNSFPLDLRW